MRAYALRRGLLVVPTLVGVSLLAFALANLAPGDPAEELLRRTTERPPSPEEVATLRRELGLDRPLVVQYARWVGDVVRGDLGTSYATRRPVSDELGRRVPLSLELAVPAALLALAIALPAGLLSAVHRNRLIDQVLRVASLVGASVPSFWLALLLIGFFAVRLSLAPVAGRGGASSMVLPVVTLAMAPAAVLARFTRSTMLEALGEDYVATARAKGVAAVGVVAGHALRNALIPLVTAFGTSLGHLLAGVVVIETVFVWPGAGKALQDAILQRDYPLIQGFVLYAGAIFLVVNLLVDLSYALIDPRVRLGAGGATPT